MCMWPMDLCRVGGGGSAGNVQIIMNRNDRFGYVEKKSRRLKREGEREMQSSIQQRNM